MLTRRLGQEGVQDGVAEHVSGQVRVNRRTAARQLENADLYLVAVENLQLGDAVAERAVRQLRDDVHALRWRLTRPVVLS